jgi:co-chaperonin GroES (HSP10)
VEPGDVVYLAFAYQQPIQIKLDGQKYLIVRERDVISLVG